MVKKTREPKEITLPSGSIAVIKPFTAGDVMAMRRSIDTAAPEESFMYALIAATTTIDGESLVLEDVQELDGFDYLMLMGEFTGAANFQASPSK